MTTQVEESIRCRPWCVFLVLAVLAVGIPLAEAQTAIPVPRGSVTNDSETLVDIPDAALRNAVEKALNKAAGDPITRGEMATLQSLSVTGCAALTSIEHAVNLKDFASVYGRVSTLEPLGDLTSLTSLAIIAHRDRISDLRPLANLTLLERLTVSEAEVVDLRPLSDLTALNFIELDRNAIVDLSPLGGLTSLRHLELSENKVTDLGPLSGLASLRWLQLRHNEIVDLSPLASLTSLNYIELNSNKIVDLAPLADFTWPHTLHLDLRDNAIEDLAPLVAHEELGLGDWVVLNGNPLSLKSNETHTLALFLRGVNVYSDYLATPIDIPDTALRTAVRAAVERLRRKDPRDGIYRHDMWYVEELGAAGVRQLAGIENAILLRELALTDGSIAEIGPLTSLTALRTLDLSRNEVAEIEPLTGSTTLVRLVLSGNEIVELGPLANLTLLEYLDLSHNEIVELEPIEGLAALVTLDLSGNQIADIAPLAGLKHLVRLVLSSNEIVDLAPLADLSLLEYLDLSRNEIDGVAALAGLKALAALDLSDNAIADVAALLRNDGLGGGDVVDLRGNPLGPQSLGVHIPTLARRGVEVQVERPGMHDARLQQAIDRALSVYVVERSWRRRPFFLDTLPALDASNRGIVYLNGLEIANELQGLYLDGNRITDIWPLAYLFNLEALTLSGNNVIDWTPLTGMRSLIFLALDGCSLDELPTLPPGLFGLYLTQNNISDVNALSDQSQRWLVELQLSANSITSLAPLAGMERLQYLHVDDNRIEDLSPLNFEPLREVLLRNNKVRDLSPLLQGERLFIVDVRRNPLADDALEVLDTLRERGVTVLAGETVPYFPAVGDSRQGFVRVVNRSDEAGHVFIEAVDDAGVRALPVRMEIGARLAVHFNSGDLENGNAAKGLSGGIGASTAGDWRLSVISALDVEVLSYIRTEDGFVTAMHDVATEAMAPFFNPGSNDRQRSILRVVNMEAEPAKWTTGGYDDHGQWHPMAGSLLVRPQHALTLTARALEDDHGLGDGHGKWRLRTRGFPWYAMSLLESPTGHLTNLSTAPENATVLADGRTLHRLPLFPAAGGSREGFVRVINRSYSSGEVVIEAVDDAGTRSGPVRLTMRPRQAAHFNSMDLEAGNDAKGLSAGIGVGSGDWRLEITSTLDLQVLSYIRTSDGFLTSMHDLAPRSEDGDLWIPFFNPGANRNQVSHLRLANSGDTPADATITAIDDGGHTGDAVRVTIPAHAAQTFTAAELETGNADGLSGALGDGQGKWRLRVATDEDVDAMSLLSLPTGHLTNLSTTPRYPPRQGDL